MCIWMIENKLQIIELWRLYFIFLSWVTTLVFIGVLNIILIVTMQRVCWLSDEFCSCYDPSCSLVTNPSWFFLAAPIKAMATMKWKGNHCSLEYWRKGERQEFWAEELCDAQTPLWTGERSLPSSSRATLAGTLVLRFWESAAQWADMFWLLHHRCPPAKPEKKHYRDMFALSLCHFSQRRKEGSFHSLKIPRLPKDHRWLNW